MMRMNFQRVKKCHAKFILNIIYAQKIISYVDASHPTKSTKKVGVASVIVWALFASSKTDEFHFLGKIRGNNSVN